MRVGEIVRWASRVHRVNGRLVLGSGRGIVVSVSDDGQAATVVWNDQRKGTYDTKLLAKTIGKMGVADSSESRPIRDRGILGRRSPNPSPPFPTPHPNSIPPIKPKGDILGIVPVEHLPWRLLPPGEPISVGVIRHFCELSHRNLNKTYDIYRINCLLKFGPTKCYVGIEEFEGYVVFLFSYTQKVVLESPVVGNATYILGSDWKRLCRLTKWELLSHPTAYVSRVIHRGDWLARLRNEIV